MVAEVVREKPAATHLGFVPPGLFARYGTFKCRRYDNLRYLPKPFNATENQGQRYLGSTSTALLPQNPPKQLR